MLTLLIHSQPWWGHQSNPSFHNILEGKEVLREVAFFKRKKCVGRWPVHCLARGFFYGVLLHSFRLKFRLSEPQLETGPLTQKLELTSDMYTTGSLPLRSSNIIILHSSLTRQLTCAGRKKASSSQFRPYWSCAINAHLTAHYNAHSQPKRCKVQMHQEHHCIDMIITEVI